MHHLSGPYRGRNDRARRCRLSRDADTMARKVLENSKVNGLNGPYSANKILNTIREKTGVSDPYHDFKALEMTQAQGIIEQIQGLVGTDLQTRVGLAAPGNRLDFFKDTVKAPVDSFLALWRDPYRP